VLVRGFPPTDRK